LIDQHGRAADMPSGAMGGAWLGGMAFRWLHILDTAPQAGQPMRSTDGRVLLMLNGEIYNYRELRQDLVALGHAFHTRSDTEVVLAAYRQWGVAMFDRLNGMWAMVLVDLRLGKVLVSRDRFGIKPLFHAHAGGCLLFASEVKQLLAAGVPPAANPHAVARFIGGRRPGSPQDTFFSGVLAVPAASYAEFDLRAPPGVPAFLPYWRLAEVRNADADGPRSWDDALEGLEQIVASSVMDHVTGPPPIAMLISGGLDSSLVAALAVRAYAARNERGTGISMYLADADGRLDERDHIMQVVDMLGYQGHSIAFAPDWLKGNIARISRTQEEPLAGMAVAGQFLTYSLAAARGCRVALDGQGADELFAGYPRHQLVYLRDCLRRMELRPLVQALSSLLRHEPRLLSHRTAGWLRRASGGASHPRPAFLRPLGIDGVIPPAAWAGPPPAQAADRSRLDAVFRHDIAAGNLRSVLAVTDRNAMAHSIEARVPYVDRRVVEFAYRLPARFKLGDGQRKRILRLLGERHLPHQLTNRTDRIGFGAPTAAWLQGHFRAELAALPAGRAFADSVLVDAGRLRSYVADYLAGRSGDAGTLWRLYALEHWAQAYSVTGL
jgi:asparagine synthase (glutamine-hydrolysing)